MSVRSSSSSMKKTTSAAVTSALREQDLVKSSAHDFKEKYTVEKMTNAKHSRQIAESDLQLLANRVALLRAEELKANNKINETKNKKR